MGLDKISFIDHSKRAFVLWYVQAYTVLTLEGILWSHILPKLLSEAPLGGRPPNHRSSFDDHSRFGKRDNLVR